MFVASTHDYLMIFTRRGHCYWKKVWEIPVAGRTARGKPIVNLLDVDETEQIAAVVPVREFRNDQYLLFGTRQGVVKKTVLSAYGNVRSVGLNAINIRDDDELIDVQVTSGEDEILLASREGMAIRFHESDVRLMGRAAEGVRGLRLHDKDYVIGMVVVRPGSTLLVVAERGLGKRTEVDAYRFQRRGGSGVINLKTTDRTGQVVAVMAVRDDEQLMVVTRQGVVNRQRVNEISLIGRATQGVKLVNLDEGDMVVDVARVITDEEAGAFAAEGADDGDPADDGEVEVDVEVEVAETEIEAEADTE
jgi:DNA gyrase subunit A